jgi:hypothetical protein
MIKVNFDPKTLTGDRKTEWDDWSARAKAATENIIGQWESWKAARKKGEKDREGNPPDFEPKFDNKVWTGFRDWLLENVFHNKCAYCETPVEGFLGDAEHFRPKGRVRDLTEDDISQVVTVVDEDGAEINHPGYFWLAYHWRNLLPSCELCNRYGGKQDLFPVGTSHVAVKRLRIEELDTLIRRMTKSQQYEDVFYMEPEDLDRLEGRVLLHPYDDEPEQVIYFEINGEAAAWDEEDERAKKSIRIYALNHKKKVAARARAQRDGLERYVLKIAGIAGKQDLLDKAKDVAREFREEYYEGERPYAVATFDYIHYHLEGKFDPDVLLGPRRVKRNP